MVEDKENKLDGIPELVESFYSELIKVGNNATMILRRTPTLEVEELKNILVEILNQKFKICISTEILKELLLDGSEDIILPDVLEYCPSGVVLKSGDSERYLNNFDDLEASIKSIIFSIKELDDIYFLTNYTKDFRIINAKNCLTNSVNSLEYFLSEFKEAHDLIKAS